MKTFVRSTLFFLVIAHWVVIPAPAATPKRHATLARLRAPQTKELHSGQSTTLLPDGNWLLLGGLGSDGKPESTAAIRNGRTGSVVQLQTGLTFARAWHSATVLPNGQVLVFGGVGRDERVVRSAELFDSVKQTFTPLKGLGLQSRAHHTATVLTDGSLLVAGGVGADGSMSVNFEEWSFRSGASRTLPALLLTPRQDHSARLLVDGTVLFWGGANTSVDSLKYGELFDPAGQTSRIEVSQPPVPNDSEAPQLAVSIPADGDGEVPVNSFVAVRFSKALAVSSVNKQTITLTGPQGQVSGTVFPAEQGMLAFLIPDVPVAEGAKYTATLEGLSDPNGLPLPSQDISFRTVGGDNNSGPVVPVIPVAIGPSGNGPGDSKGVPTPPAMPPLEAPPGVTALSGRVLQLNGMPLPGVLLQIDDKKSLTDETGRFLLGEIAAGHHAMVIDGGPASHGEKVFGLYEVGVDIKAAQTNVLPYIIWMKHLDMEHAATIASPTITETVIKTPLLPGLELHIPPKTVVTDHYGKVVTKISITPIPLDQPPFPLPRGVRVPIYFTIQPGGAYLEVNNGGDGPKGARLIYPNTFHNATGALFDFWNYDADAKGWFVYGQGKVSKDGKQIVPEPGVEIYEFTGAMVAGQGFAPSPRPTAGNPASAGGDPVDLSTGLFIYSKTDLTVSDVIPITLTRTYRQQDSWSRAFGIGTTHNYDMFLVSNSSCPQGFNNPNCVTDAELVLPDGSQVPYRQISLPTDPADVLQNNSTPGEFYGTKISWNASNRTWNLAMKDGTHYIFPESDAATIPQQGGLIGIVDRYGNALTIGRNLTTGQIGGITTQSNRWVQFTYDGNNRITQVQDNIGRTVGYTYDSNGNLVQFTDANGGITKYTYGTSNQMTAIVDPRGITYLTNEYDGSQRVIRQTQGDGSSYQFAYFTNPGTGKITETDVTDPLGHVRKVTYNANGFTQSQIVAAGLPEQQTTIWNWDLNTNLLQSVVDPAGYQTSYSYDAMGNTTKITQMAGTAAETATSFTYESIFNQVTSITDPLQHTVSFAYDSNGSLISIQNPTGSQLVVTYNTAGQLASITDPMQNAPTQFIYETGDLVGLLDPLGRTTTFFNDLAGRRVAVTDGGGQTTRFVLNSLNQITSSTDTRGGSTQFSYDANGNLTSLTDARGNQTKYEYDNMERLVTHTDQLGAVEKFQYDAMGNLSNSTDRRGKKTVFAFDGLDRLKFIGYGTQNGPIYDSTISFSYDALDRLIQTLDTLTGNIVRQFDDISRSVTETSANGSVTYAYDAAGRRSSMQVTGQSVVNYAYDSADRLTQIVQGILSAQFMYDSDGRRQTTTLPNGITATYTYDAASQLDGISFVLGSNVLGNLTYSYDVLGRRANVGGSFARTGLPLPISVTGYNPNNQMTSWGTANLFYDANGNMTSDGTHSYSWDSRNRLTSIDNGTTASLAYDSLGRRTSKSILGTTTAFLYDGVSAIQETVGGTNTASLLVGGIDEVLERTESAGPRTFLTDARGSTLALADSSGTIQTQYSFDPFGNAAFTGSATTNSYTYTGRELDANGLYYYRARYYNPSLHRFISEDPLGFAGGDANVYAYAGNDPIDFRDPSGLDYHVNFDPNINTVAVTASVTIYGPNATSDLAKSWERDANSYWNAGKFKYGNCNVRFNFKFSADPKNNWRFNASPKADNYVNVIKQKGDERILDETWSSYGRWLSGLADQDVAHSMGHFLGLGDDYSVIFGTKKGHAGHMMTNDVIRNVVQHEVDDVLAGRACGCKK